MFANLRTRCDGVRLADVLGDELSNRFCEIERLVAAMRQLQGAISNCEAEEREAARRERLAASRREPTKAELAQVLSEIELDNLWADEPKAV